MTDLPIIFSAPMVRAILRKIEHGTGKTQTRRIINPQPIVHDNGVWQWDSSKSGYVGASGTHLDEGFPQTAVCHSHYKPGGLLWVREAWRVGKGYDPLPGSQFTSPRVHYEADGDVPDWAGRYRHARFMPRWASRITLIVTDVRVERLQDISEADAITEGVDDRDPICGFSEIWDHIHGPGSWEENPWVVAYSFRPQLGNIDQIGSDNG